MRASALPLLLLGTWFVACGADSGDQAVTIGAAAPAEPSPTPGGSAARDAASATGDTGDARSAASDAGGGAQASADAGEEQPKPYVPFDINHVLETGQSNAIAINAFPLRSVAQPDANIMFNVGVITASQCDGNGCLAYDTPTSFIPLVEGDHFFGGAGSRGVETLSSGLANQISALARVRTKDATHSVLTSLHGRSGNAYYCVRKGGCEWWPGKPYVKPFDEGMRQVEDAMGLATSAGKSYVVRAVTTVHGETDHYSRNFPHEGSDGTPGKIQNYSDALLEWQSDYDVEIKKRTGQSLDVPLLVSQMSNWNNTTDSRIPLDQYAAHVRAPRKVVLVTPAYMLPFQNDCLHLTAEAQVRLGEYFAKAYARIVFDGRSWEPVRPKSLARTGNVITITYLVPVPPLTLDTTAVTDPGNYGFELRDSAGTQVSTVEIRGPETVTITLSAVPAADAVLRYAASARAGTCPGPFKGPRGNLRDSDDQPSRTGNSLSNWGVAYELPVP